MKFSHHAKNRARLYGLTLLEIELAVASAGLSSADKNGNLILEIDDLRVVVAVDNPDFVITLFRRKA